MQEAFLKQWSKVPFWAQFGICIIGGVIVVSAWVNLTMTPSEKAHHKCLNQLRETTDGLMPRKDMDLACEKIVRSQNQP